MERLAGITIERLTDLSSRLFSTKPTVAAVGPVGTLAASARPCSETRTVAGVSAGATPSSTTRSSVRRGLSESERSSSITRPSMAP